VRILDVSDAAPNGEDEPVGLAKGKMRDGSGSWVEEALGVRWFEREEEGRGAE
jgi:hypothetical protein